MTKTKHKSVDPIFAAIEAHKAACATKRRTCKFLAPLAIAAAKLDPAFAAIEQYKAAVRARQVVIYAKYETNREFDDASTEAFDAEFDALDDLLDTTPTTIAGIVALLEVLGTDPYGDGRESVLGWAFNGPEDCHSVIAANQLMLKIAAVLRNGGLS
jgi:hypothetical protein